ncbi:2-amino-4-hydroxy-6-hydroxymethyldihydropteridine diphosphokinase [Aliikangiella sp. IMCC44359]|uniref:2-amino-4-hydroxy-6- hydroxymethyldihydropteridine diphosphokinase n=1 Tax=Aliikangiella sp. IMCC44359 TaxID=3459125 RepID=UPI00403B37E5
MELYDSSTSQYKNHAFIGIGANLNNPKKQVKQAFILLNDIVKTQLVKNSSLFLSDPMGPQDQDDYVNAVALISTDLEPFHLLEKLQEIEHKQGRVRKQERWGPRVLDLDLLLYNDNIIDHPKLKVPHYGMHVRNFVIMPLAEIAPNLKLPDGTTVQSLLKQIDKKGIRIL